VDERLDLALINKVGDFPKNVTLSFAANNHEWLEIKLFPPQWPAHKSFVNTSVSNQE